MGIFRVQMIHLILDMFFHLLPQNGQIIIAKTRLPVNGISSLSKMPGKSQQGDHDQLAEISNDLSLLLSSRKKILGASCSLLFSRLIST